MAFYALLMTPVGEGKNYLLEEKKKEKAIWIG